jgi:NADH-quinone oxidoreductase subunit J
MAVTLFVFLSAVCVASVVAMIVSRNQAHNALFLVACFAALGGIFGLLEAPFVAVVQVIVYAGAIMVLFVFTIMMINLEEPLPPEKTRRILVLSSVLAIVLLGELVFVVAKEASSGPSGVVSPLPAGTPKELGHLLFTKFLYPFEITSLLLIAALVGALTLARKEGET